MIVGIDHKYEYIDNHCLVKELPDGMEVLVSWQIKDMELVRLCPFLVCLDVIDDFIVESVCGFESLVGGS